MTPKLHGVIFTWPQIRRLMEYGWITDQHLVLEVTTHSHTCRWYAIFERREETPDDFVS